MPPENSKIRVLPDALANKIAAGEVVERPASVVKELIENSIDAGASVIRVEVEAGGRRLIRVTDDGCGMSHDDALLSLERHATSKLNTEADLFSVRTLGFRGEALPSVAAVSRFEMLTRPAEADAGVRLRVEGGVFQNVEPAGCASGTVVTVRDIFYNVPARKKFMRSETTELANISELVARIAIAYPDLHFQLIHEDREVIEAPPSKDLSGRIADALGAGVLSSMTPVAGTGRRDIKIHGMVSLPELSRSTASHIYFYVNRRAVRDRMMIHALLDSYQGLLPKRRYPVAALFIEIDPAEVDVNVHPTKAEVKFRDHGAVFDTIRSAVTDAFSRKSARSVVTLPPPEREFNRTGRIMEAVSEYVENRLKPGFQESEKTRDEEKTETSLPRTTLKPVTKPRPWGYFADLKVLGQLRATYIVCQSPEGLLLIDQHAAHERTAFERLRKEFSRDRVLKQTLLFPATIELGYREAAEMERSLDALNRVGFDVEPFGQRTWRISAQPAVLGSADPKTLAADVIEAISSLRSADPLRDHLDEIFARMACHAVIRANRNLTPEEMNALLKSLDDADHPLTCPHGRPICVHIGFDELEKMFGRK